MEVIGTNVSSLGNGIPKDLSGTAVLPANRFVKMFDCQHGDTHCEVSTEHGNPIMGTRSWEAEHWKSQYRITPNATSRYDECLTPATIVVENGCLGANETDWHDSGCGVWSNEFQIKQRHAGGAPAESIPSWRQSLTTVAYRCVCGEAIQLDAGQGGQCDACGRRYSPTALQDPVAQTMSLSEIDADRKPNRFELQQPDPWVGRELDHYKIVEPLGRGGMGQVYRALDQSLERYVAVKVIRKGDDSIEDTRQLKNLFQEATAQARVNHPNIAHIYYVGRETEHPFLAMELVDGQTLTDEMNDRPMEFGAIISAATQIADALRHAIEFDIVHGDIKPSNIMITSKGQIKLADFGLARRMSDQQTPESISGTPQYLAPEIANGQSPTALSDIYSLGVTLFQLTFGRMPYTFADHTLQGLMQTHRDSAVEFPKAWPQDLPLRWRDVLEKMLAKSPTDRYQTYAELLKDLESVRPVALPHAGRFQRSLAWLVDMALVNTATEIVALPVRLTDAQDYFFPLAFIGLICPIVAGMLQARWETTPGKRLFQIRIVDRYGLVPGKATLAARMVAQMLLVWAGALVGAFTLLSAEWVVWVLAPAAFTLVAIDIASSFARDDRKTVHDLIFGTRVALDAAEKSPESDNRYADPRLTR